jgi:hypothetical protein
MVRFCRSWEAVSTVLKWMKPVVKEERSSGGPELLESRIDRVS